MNASSSRQDLEAAYQAYRTASMAWRAAASGRPTASYVDACAERLLKARVGVYEALAATGWEAPPTVAVQLERDRALIAVPEDLEALLTSVG